MTQIKPDVFAWGPGTVDPCDLHPMLPALPGCPQDIQGAQARLLPPTHTSAARLEIQAVTRSGAHHQWTVFHSAASHREANGRIGFALPAPLDGVTVWAPVSSDFKTLDPTGGWNAVVR
jgi:hypothetical protein